MVDFGAGFVIVLSFVVSGRGAEEKAEKLKC
jgi:hypothetical protein